MRVLYSVLAAGAVYAADDKEADRAEAEGSRNWYGGGGGGIFQGGNTGMGSYGGGTTGMGNYGTTGSYVGTPSYNTPSYGTTGSYTGGGVTGGGYDMAGSYSGGGGQFFLGGRSEEDADAVAQVAARSTTDATTDAKRNWGGYNNGWGGSTGGSYGNGGYGQTTGNYGTTGGNYGTTGGNYGTTGGNYGGGYGGYRAEAKEGSRAYVAQEKYRPGPAPCEDVSTNCQQACHGEHGTLDYCTNSNVCPTCGDYMSVWCRGTCADFIGECMDGGDECYQEGKRIKTIPGSVIKTDTGCGKLHKCQHKCDKEAECTGFNFNKSMKTCELLRRCGERENGYGWESATKDCESVPQSYRFVFGDVEIETSTVMFAAGGVGMVAVAAAVFAVYRKKYASISEFKEPLVSMA